MITNNSNDDYVFLFVFLFQIMSMLLMKHNRHFTQLLFPVYTAWNYRDPKLDTGGSPIWRNFGIAIRNSGCNTKYEIRDLKSQYEMIPIELHRKQVWTRSYPRTEKNWAEVTSVYGEFIRRSLVIHSFTPAFVALNVMLSKLARSASYKTIFTCKKWLCYNCVYYYLTA